jgi:2-polyprenyl-3-methyl-5-hydroxy-6-metoxy-1,4-benzoquinol methylase
MDTVMCSEVLEHLWEPQKVHHEAMRVLRPGGHYIISTPNFDNLSWVMDHGRDMMFRGTRSDHYEHIRWYNYEVHKSLLEQVGFKIIDHVGADAHGVEFFQKPRSVLFYIFKDLIKKPLSEGQMFPKHCATIMVIAKKD